MFSDDNNRRIPKRKRFSQIVFAFIVLFIFIIFAVFFISMYLPTRTGSNLFVILFIFIVFALSIGWNVYNYQTWKKSWEELAQNSGLTLQKGMVVGGNYRGHPLKLDTFTRGFGRNKRHYTRIHVMLLDPLNGSLEFQKAGLWNKLRKGLGSSSPEAAYVEMGDEAFDRHLLIKSTPPSLAARTLSSFTLRQGLTEAAEQAYEFSIEINETALLYSERNRIRDIEYLRALLDLLVELADAAVRVSSTHSIFDH